MRDKSERVKQDEVLLFYTMLKTSLMTNRNISEKKVRWDMNGYRFYEDFESKHDKRYNISHGSVIAAIVVNGIYWTQRYNEKGEMKPCACYESISATFFYQNSPVSGGGVALDYLSENCKRISEKRAREIHPELFRVLDDPIE